MSLEKKHQSSKSRMLSQNSYILLVTDIHVCIENFSTSSNFVLIASNFPTQELRHEIDFDFEGDHSVILNKFAILEYVGVTRYSCLFLVIPDVHEIRNSVI